MPRWAIVVEETTGSGDHQRWSPRVLAEVVGTREQAMTKLHSLVPAFTPQHPRLPGRRMLLRNDDTYLLIARGWADDYHCVFRVWEIVSDTDRPESAGNEPNTRRRA